MKSRKCQSFNRKEVHYSNLLLRELQFDTECVYTVSTRSCWHRVANLHSTQQYKTRKLKRARKGKRKGKRKRERERERGEAKRVLRKKTRP
jgi:hypothetical protein